jgi:hypothetical protein
MVFEVKGAWAYSRFKFSCDKSFFERILMSLFFMWSL